MKVSTTSRHCAHVKPTGEQCGAYAQRDSQFCFMHDPARAASRATARSKGGKARHGRAIRYIPSETGAEWSIDTIEGIRALLRFAIEDCLEMDRSLKRTNALAGLIRVAVTVNEQTELAERIAALEAIEANRHLPKVGTNGRY